MLTEFGVPKFGQFNFGGSNSLRPGRYVIGKAIALVGDVSSHGGVISTSGGNTTVNVGGVLVAINGASHICPIPLHGTTAITAITVKSYVGGKLIVTYGAQAACGAIILPRLRGVTVE